MAFNREYKRISADTKRLLSGQEGRDLDFKVSSQGVKPELFVAFANSRGGTILVGVDEEADENGIQRGLVVGCKTTDEIKQAFISIAASCRPSINIDIRIENTSTSKPIFRIDVSEGTDKPYCTHSGLYKTRAEGQNIALEPAMLNAIILEKEADQFITRFKLASDDLLDKLERIHNDLGGQIERVEWAASNAAEAARAAVDAAENAAMWAAS